MKQVLVTIGTVQVWVPKGSKIPGGPGSQKRRIVEFLFEHGSIEHYQCEQFCGSCTVVRSRIPELREELKALGYTITRPEDEGDNWKQNKTNGGRHRVYHLVRHQEELNIFNDPWGIRQLRRQGGAA